MKNISSEVRNCFLRSGKEHFSVLLNSLGVEEVHEFSQYAQSTRDNLQSILRRIVEPNLSTG